MAHQPNRSPIRLLAPAALAVCAIAFLLIVLTTGGGDDGSGSGSASETSTAPKAGTKAPAARKPKPKAATYTVKAGDNLGSIAAKTDVPVETLQEINPELDPQALVAGQKIKLKE